MTRFPGSRSIRMVSAAAIAAVVSLGGVSAANAETRDGNGEGAVESPMHFSPMTRENAADAGYEVRENPDGTLYGVPIGTPEGSHEREVRVGAVPESRAKGTVSGNCGTASVDFLSKTVISTSYRISPSFGLPVSHNWQVTYSSPIDLTWQDFSGIPAWGSQSWSATASVRGQANKGQRLTAMASGTVLTSWGYCSAGNPVATITL